MEIEEYKYASIQYADYIKLLQKLKEKVSFMIDLTIATETVYDKQETRHKILIVY